jgi:hypothetical protein
MRQPQRGFAIVFFLIFAALLVLGTYLYYQSGAQSSQHVADTTAPASTGMRIVTGEVAGIICYENAQYVVIAKDNTPDVGIDLLVKYKSSPEQQIACTYTVQAGDYEIKNGNGAQYYYTITGNFLITDNGTAPDPRGLAVFDLEKRALVFTDRYSKPISVDGTTVQYWATSTEEPTDANCPDMAAWKAGGLGAAIDVHVSLNLTTLQKTDMGERRCAARQ